MLRCRCWFVVTNSVGLHAIHVLLMKCALSETLWRQNEINIAGQGELEARMAEPEGGGQAPTNQLKSLGNAVSSLSPGQSPDCQEFWCILVLQLSSPAVLLLCKLCSA